MTGDIELNDPLSVVEADMRKLMKECGTLKHELDENRKKYFSEREKILLDFIEVVDGFEKLFRNIEENLKDVDQRTQLWIGNFRTLYKLLLRSLKGSGVSPIEVVCGERVDHHFHRVVEVDERPDLEAETIVEEVKRGYMWQDQLLRASEVKAVGKLK